MAARFGHIRSYLKKQTNEGAAGMSAVCTDSTTIGRRWYKISVRPMASPKRSCVIVD